MERAPLVLTFLAAACASQESSSKPPTHPAQAARTIGSHSGLPDDKLRMQAQMMEMELPSPCDLARQTFENVFALVAHNCEVGRLDAVTEALKRLCRETSTAVKASIDVQLEHVHLLRKKCQHRPRRTY